MDYCRLLLTNGSELCNVQDVDTQNLLRNPMRMEILHRVHSGHALSRGFRNARALANDHTTDWGSQS